MPDRGRRRLARRPPPAAPDPPAPTSPRHAAADDRAAPTADAGRAGSHRATQRLGATASRARHVAHLPHGLAAARRVGRAGADRRAGARGHGLRDGLGRAGHLRPVRDHLRAAGLRRLRAQPGAGAGPRLVAGRARAGRRAAVVGGRSAACDGAGRDDRGGVWRAVPAGRGGTAGLRHRAAVQADPLWLHERHRPDGAGQPAAAAVRLLGRR